MKVKAMAAMAAMAVIMRESVKLLVRDVNIFHRLDSIAAKVQLFSYEMPSLKEITAIVQVF